MAGSRSLTSFFPMILDSFSRRMDNEQVSFVTCTILCFEAVLGLKLNLQRSKKLPMEGW